LDAALTQATHHPELWTDWRDVWVDTRGLEAFLAEFAPTPGAHENYRSCVDYLVKERKQYPDDPVTRDKYEERCRDLIPGLSRRRFMDAWRQAKQEAPAKAWDAPGRRPEPTRKPS
jgi:hypothetical protein